MTKSQKAAALVPYLRKSSGEDEALSFDRQRKAIQAWAAQHDVELAPEVIEPGVSGSADWRKRALGSAVASVESGEVAGLIVDEQNRLTRGRGSQSAGIWEALDSAKARLVCIADGVDTATGDHELLFSIKAALARQQWKEYKRRSDAVKVNRVESGVFIGPAPTGYVKKAKGKDASDADKALALDPKLAPIVRRLFEMRATGSSWGELLTFLDGENLQMTQQGVSGIIRNPAYRGDLVYGDLVKTDAHPAIVDRPLWAAAQRVGKAPARSGRKSTHPMSGRVVCGSCGSSMIIWKGAATRKLKRKDGTEYTYTNKQRERRFRCTNRACPDRMSVDATKALHDLTAQLFDHLGSTKTTTIEGVDLAPLEDAVEVAQRRLDQVMAPEARDALGEMWAADAKARRVELESAQAELGEAQAAAPASTQTIDLDADWDTMTDADKAAMLDHFGARLKVSRGERLGLVID